MGFRSHAWRGAGGNIQRNHGSTSGGHRTDEEAVAELVSGRVVRTSEKKSQQEAGMVKMASKLTFGTAMSDWQERINVERMRHERADKARQVMKKHGVAAVLATGAHNTRYLTGLRGAEFLPQLWYVLFFAEHDPIAFLHAGWYH